MERRIMYIVPILFTIGGILLFLTATILLIRTLPSTGEGFFPNVPANICRCCYEPEAPIPGAVCRACLYVRTIGAVEEKDVLDNYEREISQQDVSS